MGFWFFQSFVFIFHYIFFNYWGFVQGGSPSCVYLPPWKKGFFMALLNENLVAQTSVNINRGIPRGANGSGTSSSSSSPRGSQPGEHTSLAEMVINSTPYQNAYKLFSAESNQIWLQRLIAIPYSVDDANNTWLDDLGLSNNYQDKQDANYQYCMEQISSLVAEYQSWKNSLPSTQVQQLNDAGINAAVTGQGVDASSIPNVGVSSDPSQLLSTNPVEVFGSALGTAVDFIMTPVNGFADLAVKFRQLHQTDRSLKFNENSALLEFYKYATENGYSVDTNILNGTFGDLFKYGGFSNPKGERINSEEVLKGFLSHHVNSPLYAGLAQLYPEIVNTFNIDGASYTHTGYGPVSVGLSQVVKSQLAMYRNEERYRLSLKKYQTDIGKYEANSAEYNSISAKHNEEYQNYLKEKQRITQELIDRLANSKSEEDMLLLSKILLGYNYDDIDILNAVADGAEVRQITGAIGDIFHGYASHQNISR